MVDVRRSTQQLLRAVQTADANTPLDRLLVPTLLVVGIVYAAIQLLERDWVESAYFVISLLVLIALAAVPGVQNAVMGQRFNRRHAAHIVLLWMYGVALINLLRLLPFTEPTGKNGTAFATLFAIAIGVWVMFLRSLLILTRRGYTFFSARIPIWEQFLLTANEAAAVLLVAAFASVYGLRLLEADVFTIRANPAYVIGLGVTVLLYYFGMQLMWIQAVNDWLSRNAVWVRLARLLTPFTLIVVTLIILNRLVQRTDPRTANLTGSANTSLAILAIAPVIWLIVFVILILVYTGRRGLRQRFMPDALLEWLPGRLGRILRGVSDMDMLLIVLALTTSIPTYLLVVGGDSSRLVGIVRQQIAASLGAFLETNEQILALMFAAPFYLLIVGLLILYSVVLSRPGLSAKERDDLVERLPIGFLIILVITLYLFAVPFSQVFTEGRLPRIPQDLGRILAFNIVIPLVMLYAHYYVLVRIPYGRGQRRWREGEAERLNVQLHAVDRRLDDLNRQLQQLDRTWQESRSGQGGMNLTQNFETLYRYMQLNSLRDDINMQRFQVLTERQELTEISEAPVSLAVARLPIRVVSLGIPLLLAIQIYQWAVINNGLRAIIENPNLTIFEFFRAILEQTQF
ncbi:MAG: hypothetical protein SF162_18165 [bacterium]|nr:hypothetical protein [bacterium]